MDILKYLNTLSAKGRYSFTLDEAIADTGKSRSAIIPALRRQMKHHRIALPLRGFYLIVPPTYQLTNVTAVYLLNIGLMI